MSSYTKWLEENQASITEYIQADALNWLNELAIEHGYDGVHSIICNSESFCKIPKNGKESGSKSVYKATFGYKGSYPYLNVIYSNFSRGQASYSSREQGVVRRLWTAHKENREPAPIKPVTVLTPQNNVVRPAKKSTVALDLARFASLSATGEHAYLARKQISSVIGSQMRFGSDKRGKYIALLVIDFKPVKRGIQRIYEDGAKRFSTGLEKVGGFICIGNYVGASKIVICEGYATGASIHLATDYAVLCALDAGNLAHIAGGLKIWLALHNQTSTVIIAADNDVSKDASKPNENKGLEKARAACESTGFNLAYPNLLNGISTDFNDLHLAQGLGVVKSCIDNAVSVSSQDAKHIPATPKNVTENILLGCMLMEDYNKPLKQGQASEIFVKHCGYLLGYDQTLEKFRVYKNGRWELIADLKPLVYTWVQSQTFGGKYTEAWLKGTINLVAASCAKNFLALQSTNKHLLPFRNGVFDTNKQILLPHSPDYYLTWQLPHDYIKGSDCPRFKAFLRESVTHDDVVQVLRAYINAVICRRSYLQRYLQLIGAGGSGKSTFTDILVALVGIENSKSTSFQATEEDKFELANLAYMALIVYPDQIGLAKNPSNFKKITGNDTLPIRLMHKQHTVDCVFQGMVIVTANQDIVTTDNSSGLHRRQITVRFDNQPTRNHNLKAELQAEISGIVNWVMELSSSEVDYLLSQCNTSEVMQQQTTDNLVSINHIARFFLAKFEASETGRVPIGMAREQTIIRDIIDSNGNAARISEKIYENQESHLYPCYVAYCGMVGEKPLNHINFSSRFVDVIQNILHWGNVEKTKTNQGMVVRGIRFKAVLPPQDSDVDVQTTAHAPAAPVYESENPAPMEVQAAPVAAPTSVVPHFYESILHVGDRKEMLKKWHYMTRHLKPSEKLELKRLSEEVYQQAYDSEPSEIKRENAGRAAATEYLRKWASSHGVVSQ